jgi:hypothetical protein
VPLPALANPAELAVLSGRSASDPELLAALREASRAFRGAVRHQVTRVRDVDRQLDGNGSRVLVLPRPFPIVVDSGSNTFEISVDGEIVPADRYRLNRAEGRITLKGYHWPIPPADIEVTYTHGYDAALPTGDAAAQAGPLPGVPEDIQGAVLERAQIELNVDHGVTSRTVLGDTVQFGSSAIGATQRWADVVALYLERTGDEA